MKRKGLIILTVVLLALPFAVHGIFATTSNPTTGSPGYQMLVLHTTGAYTATATPIKFKAPWPYRVLSVSAQARVLDLGNSNETYTVDILNGSTSILSSAIPLATAALVTDGTLITAPNLTDELNCSVVLTLGGTTPSLTDLTVLMALKRQ